MTVLKCKMCGGTLEFNSGETVAECPYCGTKQTVPLMDDDKKAALYERANRLRASADFDRAFSVYEGIAQAYPTDAEAFWGELLCKYGIEYVDDPATGKKIPTCHRSSYTSILDDEAFSMVMENADPAARKVYREQAKQIEEIRKGIIDISSREAPYDVFICYKETDENGERTEDSVLAQEVYDELTEKGYRVFFARISLEDKLGEEYEPYIFAALNSAKVMLVFGTDYEYFNAVWVKNEWSRFLDLMGKGEKKYLIPCYKGIDAYDMPKEFQRLQAQDMGKIGAIQDLVRGVGKIVGPVSNNSASEPSVQNGMTLNAALERGHLSLEDENWEQAHRYFDYALNTNPKCPEAYLGNALLNKKVKSLELLPQYWSERRVDKKEVTVSNPKVEEIETYAVKNNIPGYLAKDEILKCFTLDSVYESETAGLEKLLQEATDWFRKDSDIEKVIRFGNDELKESISVAEQQSIDAIQLRLNESKNSDYQNETNISKQFDDRYEREKATAKDLYSTIINKQEEEIARKRKNRLIILFVMSIIAVIGIGIVLKLKIDEKPLKEKYEIAVQEFNSGHLDEAIPLFEELGDYSNSSGYIDLYKRGEPSYLNFKNAFDKGDYNAAFEIIDNMETEGYKNIAREYAYQSASEKSKSLSNPLTLGSAITILNYLGDYSDASEQLNNVFSECYKYGRSKIHNEKGVGYYGNYTRRASEYFKLIPDYQRTECESKYLKLDQNNHFEDNDVHFDYDIDDDSGTILIKKYYPNGQYDSKEYTVDLVLFRSDGNTMYCGYLTNEHSGVITHTINTLTERFSSTTESEEEVELYFPKERPDK